MSAQDVIRRHGRSFALPARLLGRRDGARVMRLHALCRALDDLADEDGRPVAFARLARIRNEVTAGAAVDPLSAEALDLLPPGEGRAAFADLITGLISDRGAVALPDEAALRLYCYRVAGTVGLMVCATLDLTLDPATRDRAVALGSAMQMTNIARDVAEDARAGRRYLPGTWLDLTPEAITAASPARRARIAVATARLIRLSEPLYETGRRGLTALPPRTRLAIGSAAGAYREIGRVLLARGCDPAAPRATVPAPARLRAALLWPRPPAPGRNPPMQPGSDVDLAILGGGCAGLSLAARLAGRGLSQRVVEPRSDYHDDRSWSFWAAGPGPYEACVKGRWQSWTVSAGGQSVTRRSDRLNYRTLGAGSFYHRAVEICDRSSGTDLALGTRVTAEPAPQRGRWRIETDAGAFTARSVVDTRPRRSPGGFGQYFIGREVRTDRPAFDADRVDLMDFGPPRPDRMDFTYVLPFAPDHALIEATVFGPAPPPRAELEGWLDREIGARTGGGAIETLREEAGFIPMVPAGREPLSLGPNHAHAGIAGGAARPSTGYAFQRINAQTARLADRLLRGEADLAPMPDAPFTRFMDRLFLRVLQRAPQNGPGLFLALFQGAPADRLERFLSDSTAPLDRMGVITAMPPRPFLREVVGL